MTDVSLIDRLFDVIEHDIVPKTRAGRGAAATSCSARRSSGKIDLSVVVAETNNETENPLWHGEVHA
jgi:tRNA(Arg) A34 adenosine deaminase TadA